MNMAIVTHAQRETEILLFEEPQIIGALGAALLAAATRRDIIAKGV
jgi:hypothetical protein